jgi:hypothetical protein
MRILLLLALVSFSGCTIARISTSKGVTGFYVDFHPTGAVLAAEGVLDGVGAFTISRDTGDSTSAIEAVTAVVPQR